MAKTTSDSAGKAKKNKQKAQGKQGVAAGAAAPVLAGEAAAFAAYPAEKLHEIAPYFKPRDPETHKGSYGTLLIVCGSYGMVGAAAMAAKAALRCGVGLVHVATRRECYPLLAPMLPEAVFTVLDTHVAADKLLRAALGKASACVVGCGLGADTARYLPTVLSAAQCPIVADADALHFLAGHPHLFEPIRVPLLLTPHPLEMSHLCGKTVEEIQASRLETALTFAKANNVYTILKGAGTVIATPEGDASINPTGNAGMAKGGSGDVLAGMMGAFLAQGMPPVVAAEAAVYIHGAVGDACAEALSQTAMQPTDMIDALPAYFKELSRGL